MEEIITKIEPLTSKKSLIYINDQVAFALYNNEIKKLSLKEDIIYSDKLSEEIIESILKPRALTRALNLIKAKDYTEKEIRDKLEESYYPKDLINDLIEYLEKQSFINDRRFTEAYISYYSASKTKLFLELALFKKGISNDLFNEVWKEFISDNPDTEKELMLQLLESKYSLDRYNLEEMDEKDRYKFFNKVKAFFARKGFPYSLIDELLREYFEF